MIQRTELDAAGEAAFQRDLVTLTPYLRAFARSLSGDAVLADDLAQATLLKAWKSRLAFTPGTNMKAWLFMILRNEFYSSKRRDWRWHSLDPEVAEATLVANDDPNGAMELEELRQALNHLPPSQREALVLVGAGGLSYEEAAEVCGCALGTMKSRVSRARTALMRLLNEGEFSRARAPADQSAATILAEVEALRARRPRDAA